MDDTQIRERLAKIKALFEGATTTGEREAAEAAMRRIALKMDRAKGPATPEEFRFSLPDPWSRRLFTALCRSKGFKPYRYARMRQSSLCVKAEPAFINYELWPEFQQMSAVLSQYLGELADHIIGECINPDRSEAEVVAGLPAPSASGERDG
jgi:hypothetical protein